MRRGFSPHWHRLLAVPMALLLALAATIGLSPRVARAEGACSITVQAGDGTPAISGMRVRAWRIASIDGDCALVEPFSESGVSTLSDDGSTEWPGDGTKKWSQLAEGLYCYAIVEGVPADAAAVTNAGGTAILSGLDDGVYLVVPQTLAATDGMSWSFSPSIVSVSTQSGMPDATITPKGQSLTEPERRGVMKLWDDDGSGRPDSITVQISCDGSPFATVELSDDNGWRYEWDCETGHEWTVAEKNVPSGYSFTVDARSDGSFVLTNHKSAKPGTSTPSGKTSLLTPGTGEQPTQIALISLVGCSLIAVALVVRARRDSASAPRERERR